MNAVDLQKKLIRVAKQNPPSDAVPYAFEKRIMTLLKPLPVPDSWGLWAGALWRAAVPCLGLMLVLTVWSVMASSNSAPAYNLSQEIDNTVLAAIDQVQAAELPE